MDHGNPLNKEQISPILRALQKVEKMTSAEIRVHISQAWIEPDPMAKAIQVFRLYNMSQTAKKNSVLLYLNVRKKKFAILADEGATQAVDKNYWNELARNLREDLLSTHTENAIALAVLTLGITLQKSFPFALD